MIITQVTDRAARMVARLLYQHRNNENLKALLRIWGAELQELENVIWQLQSFVGRNLDNATGALLELLGKLVGEARKGGLDPEYRYRIRARVRANRSTGTAEDIYSVFRALLGNAPTAVTQYIAGWPASFTLRIENFSLGASFVDTFARFLYDSKAAGVGGVLEFYEGPEGEAFRFATAAFLSGAIGAGVNTLTVSSTAGFPATGNLIIDEGTADEEIVTYTGLTATTFTGVSTTTLAHGIRACVGWNDSPGLGLGDHANAAVGGYLAGARSV